MSEKRWRWIILGLYCALAMAYSWLIPPWEGPDEPAHYILAVNLARVGKFSSIDRNYEAAQPQTYYRLASVPLRALYLLNPDWVAVIRPEANFDNVRQPAPIYAWSNENYQFLPGLYLLRWLNIALGLGALWLNYAAIRQFVSRDNPPNKSVIPIASLALIALIPQFLHTASTVNNDMLGILAGAFLFWWLARLTMGNVNLWDMGWMLILAFLLPYGTKLTVLPVGVALTIAITISVRRQWPDQWRWILGGGIALGIGGILFTSIFFPEMGSLFWRQIQLRLFSIKADGITIAYLWEMVSQVIWSFWGKVGWLAVGLPGWVVIVLTTLGMVGVVFEGLRKTKSKALSWVVWLVAGLTIAAVLRNGLSTINSQGRYLFPAIGALGSLMISGWANWAMIRPYLHWIVIGIMLGTNLILWFWGIIPVYYQP